MKTALTPKPLPMTLPVRVERSVERAAQVDAQLNPALTPFHASDALELAGLGSLLPTTFDPPTVASSFKKLVELASGHHDPKEQLAKLTSMSKGSQPLDRALAGSLAQTWITRAGAGDTVPLSLEQLDGLESLVKEAGPLPEATKTLGATLAQVVDQVEVQGVETPEKALKLKALIDAVPAEVRGGVQTALRAALRGGHSPLIPSPSDLNTRAIIEGALASPEAAAARFKALKAELSWDSSFVSKGGTTITPAEAQGIADQLGRMPDEEKPAAIAATRSALFDGLELKHSEETGQTFRTLFPAIFPVPVDAAGRADRLEQLLGHFIKAGVTSDDDLAFVISQVDALPAGEKESVQLRLAHSLSDKRLGPPPKKDKDGNATEGAAIDHAILMAGLLGLSDKQETVASIVTLNFGIDQAIATVKTAASPQAQALLRGEVFTRMQASFHHLDRYGSVEQSSIVFDARRDLQKVIEGLAPGVPLTAYEVRSLGNLYGNLGLDDATAGRLAAAVKELPTAEQAPTRKYLFDEVFKGGPQTHLLLE
jgi:hypothetical protein